MSAVILGVMDELTDEEAVARCRAADPDHGAFRVLYERHAPVVLAFLEQILADATTAEDALQETFIRLHRGLDGYDPTRPLVPYVLRIARNVAIDMLRARKPLQRLEAKHAPAETPAEKREMAEEVQRALDALAPEHRAVLVLRLGHGFKLEAIADALSCSERTARNRLRAGSVLLERELRRRGIVG
jgi:RNA polymerase sigma-70 factor (ECF subfamily)